MLVLALPSHKMGGRYRILCDRRNTLEACQCTCVIFSWQAQHFVMWPFAMSWQAQHFVTWRRCCFDEPATFAYLLPGHPTLSSTISNSEKKTAEKMDTNAQWFHSSWSILLKRVNIRVRGFHLVLSETTDMGTKVTVQ